MQNGSDDDAVGGQDEIESSVLAKGETVADRNENEGDDTNATGENPPAVGTSTDCTDAPTGSSNEIIREGVDATTSTAEDRSVGNLTTGDNSEMRVPVPGEEVNPEQQGASEAVDSVGEGEEETHADAVLADDSNSGADATAVPSPNPMEKATSEEQSSGDGESGEAEEEERIAVAEADVTSPLTDTAGADAVVEKSEEEKKCDDDDTREEAAAAAASDAPAGADSGAEEVISDVGPVAEVTESELSSSGDGVTSDDDDDDDTSAGTDGDDDGYVVLPPETPVAAAAAVLAPAAPASPVPRKAAAPQAAPSSTSGTTPPSYAENVPAVPPPMKIPSGAAVAPAPLPPALKKPEVVPVAEPPLVPGGGPAAAVPVTPLLLCLPADSLHTVASFLSTADWAALGVASRAANRASREVFRRVRMHGFRCATEVVTAWTRGEHADARELTSLYVKNGVPIYPLCMGHSYHTLTWRMGIEAREMEQTSDGENQEEGGNNNNAGAMTTGGGGAAAAAAAAAGSAPSTSGGAEAGRGGEGSLSSEEEGGPRLDRFYNERYDARQRDGYYAPTLTYLEEKSMFWKNRAAEEEGSDGEGGFGRILSPERRHSLSNAVSLRPPPPPPPPGAVVPPGGGLALGPPPGGVGGLPGLPPDFPPRAGGGGWNVPPAAQHHHNFFPPPGGGPFPHHGAPAALRGARGPPRRTMSTSNIGAPPLPHLRGVSAPPTAASSVPLSSAHHRPRRPKMVVRVHRHLLDQHLLGSPAVRDEGGTMESGPLSLSADFFHPHLSHYHHHHHHHHPSYPAAAAVYPSPDYPPSSVYGGAGMPAFEGQHAMAPFGAAGYRPHHAAPPQVPPPFPGGPPLAAPQQYQPHYAEAGGAPLPVVPDVPPLPAAAAAAAGQEPQLLPALLGQEDAENHESAAAAAAAGGPGPGLDFDRTTTAADDAAAFAAAGFPPPPPPPHPLAHPQHLRPYQLQHAVSFGAGPELSSLELGDRGWGGGGHHRGFGGFGFGGGSAYGTEYSVVSDVTLEVYSSSSNGLPKPGEEESEDEKSGKAAAAKAKAPEGSLPRVSPASLRRLRSRFLSYQRKLDSLLAHFDSHGFDECLLDFWDEFLPLTSGVHFYDRHTAVPRMSSLHRFLNRPCPKNVGIVQCEIERIKISGRRGKKGVGMKGRLFPTYEYRLFVRDRRHGSVESRTGPPGKVRRDTVLMTARNRGKSAGAAAAAAAAGVVGSPSTPGGSKRGANNYFLYVPQAEDVQRHFESVNDPSVFAGEGGGGGAGAEKPTPFQHPPPIGSNPRAGELGRLQSNFIGTEFQIFSPCVVKQQQRSQGGGGRRGSSSASAAAAAASRQMSYCSDSGGEDDDIIDDVAADDDDDARSNRSGVSGGPPPPPPSASRRMRRRSSFSRLSSAARRSLSRPRRGGRSRSRSEAASNPSNHSGDSAPASAPDAPGAATPSSATSERSRKGRRRSSWSNLTRKKGRAIAAASNVSSSVSSAAAAAEPVFGEEECGVITYTANLLGNRPRIMDVCVPRVGPDGNVSSEWRRHLDGGAGGGSQQGSEEGSGSPGGQSESMMSRFKQLQQRLDNPPPAAAADGNNNNNAEGGDNLAGAGADNAAAAIAGGGDEGVDAAGDNPAAAAPVTPDDFGLMALQNRPPWWNVELGAFVLNFGGRVSVASVKNFQLCDRADQEHIMLQFGRIQGRHSFTMDFQYPLSAVQAFAIAISSLQSKISFG